MKIYHPSYLGRVIDQREKDPNLPYAIFVGDNHGSHAAQQNITRLYYHHAQNNNLVLVGCEGGDPVYRPPNHDGSKIKSLELEVGRKISETFRKKTLDELVKPRPTDVFDKNTYHTYIEAAALFFGYELDSFNIAPSNRVERVKDAFYSAPAEQAKSRFFDAVVSPDVSTEMLQTFMERLYVSRKQIGMFIAGYRHLEHIKGQLPELPINYAIVYPQGLMSVVPWLEKLYRDDFVELLRRDSGPLNP